MSRNKFIVSDGPNKEIKGIHLVQRESGVQVCIDGLPICMFVSGTDYITLYAPASSTGLVLENNRVKVS